MKKISACIFSLAILFSIFMGLAPFCSAEGDEGENDTSTAESYMTIDHGTETPAYISLDENKYYKLQETPESEKENVNISYPINSIEVPDESDANITIVSDKNNKSTIVTFQKGFENSLKNLLKNSDVYINAQSGKLKNVILNFNSDVDVKSIFVNKEESGSASASANSISVHDGSENDSIDITFKGTGNLNTVSVIDDYGSISIEMNKYKGKITSGFGLRARDNITMKSGKVEVGKEITESGHDYAVLQCSKLIFDGGNFEGFVDGERDRLLGGLNEDQFFVKKELISEAADRNDNGSHSTIMFLKDLVKGHIPPEEIDNIGNIFPEENGYTIFRGVSDLDLGYLHVYENLSTEFKIDPTEKTLTKKGENFKINIVKWPEDVEEGVTPSIESTNLSVATVNEEGIVTAVDNGETDIVVTIPNTKYRAICHVIVKIPEEIPQEEPVEKSTTPKTGDFSGRSVLFALAIGFASLSALGIIALRNKKSC